MMSSNPGQIDHPGSSINENNHHHLDNVKIATTNNDDNSTTISDSIVDIPSPPPKKSTAASTQVAPVDEDWSIISSSSDLDDERSTTSSFDYQRGFGDSSNLTKNINDNNRESLQVPYQSINAAKVDGDEQETLNANLEDSQNTISTPSESPSSADSVINDREVEEDEASDDLIDVDSKIKFFENLNDSIKQRSTQFYQDFAKAHFDNYIAEQQQHQGGFNGASTCSSSCSSADYDLDDTIEILTEGSKVIIGSSNELKSTILQEKPKSVPNKSKSKSKTKTKVKKNKKLLIRGLEKLLAFLDAHSDYLYYYIFISMVIGAIPIYYFFNYILITPPAKPVTSIDKLNEVWNNLLYEDVSTTGIFGKKQKINKLYQFGNVVKDKFNEELMPQVNLFSERVKLYTTNTLVPQCAIFWAKTQEFGESSLNNVGRWWSEYSKLGVDKFNLYSKIGYAKAVEYQAIGSTYLDISYNTTSQYSKIWRKNIIAGSNDVYHNLKFIFKQETEHAKVLSAGFLEKMKVFNEYQKEKVEEGWVQVMSLWRTEAPKFKATLDHNAVEIYKHSKRFYDRVVDMLNN